MADEQPRETAAEKGEATAEDNRISGAELAVLLGHHAGGHADEAFVDPDVAAPPARPPRTPAVAKVELAAAAGAPAEPGRTPAQPPPDAGPSPERQPTQAEIDALLARLLGS